jgi:hypothetical protein
MLGDAAPVPGHNRSVLIERRVHDVDATWERVKGLVPQTIPEIVLEPTDMPWGNRSVILRDGGRLSKPAAVEVCQSGAGRSEIVTREHTGYVIPRSHG